MSPFWQRFVGGVRRERWTDVTFWALDLETSGLEPRRDEILAIGMVPIRRGAIRWSERFTTLVRPASPGAAPGAGIVAHHLLPGEVAAGLPLAQALEPVLQRLAEGILLVHFAALDVDFLERGCLAVGRRWPRQPVVDTVRLLEHLARFDYPKPPPLNSLAAARARLGLPSVADHDALTDALSTAELFLVLRHRLHAETVADLL